VPPPPSGSGLKPGDCPLLPLLLRRILIRAFFFQLFFSIYNGPQLLNVHGLLASVLLELLLRRLFARLPTLLFCVITFRRLAPAVSLSIRQSPKNRTFMGRLTPATSFAEGKRSTAVQLCGGPAQCFCSLEVDYLRSPQTLASSTHRSTTYLVWLYSSRIFENPLFSPPGPHFLL